MKIRELLKILDKKKFYGDENTEISSIASHSKRVDGRGLFVAIRGRQADGHDFLSDVYAAGVRAFLTERRFHKTDISNIVVPDTRYALARVAAEFYNHPSRQLSLIGITGTNGKTTTAFLMESIIREAGFSVGLLSTIEYHYGMCRQDAPQTTPESTDLQRMFRHMVDEGIQFAVMEVSSHGIDQRRIDGCNFDVGVFTNLTHEHLDYHETLENYYHCKEKFFSHTLKHSLKNKTVAVINMDDPNGRCLLKNITTQTIGFGLDSGDIRAVDFKSSLRGIKAEIATYRGNFAVQSPLFGLHNLYNIMAAVGSALFFHIPVTAIQKGIARVNTVPGRMERIDNGRGPVIFVDYAHTADALENALKTLRESGAKRIFSVFGCGGDRDRGKRPVMGKVAALYSDIIILTSDNPRSEPPGQIIDEIERGVLNKGWKRAEDETAFSRHTLQKAYAVCEDRKRAIEKACALALPGDVVLIAGKGHETTQQIGDKKIPFDDRNVARQAIQKGVQ